MYLLSLTMHLPAVVFRGVLNGKVSTQLCGSDRVPFRPLRFTNGPFSFENYKLRFCKMFNFFPIWFTYKVSQ